MFLAVVFWVRVPLSQAVKEVTLHCSKSPQHGGWAKPLGYTEVTEHGEVF